MVLLTRVLTSLIFFLSFGFAQAVKGLSSVEEFDKILQPVVSALGQIGARSVYLAGGSAVAYLEHIYEGKPLRMRDLDLVIDSPGISLEKAEQIGRQLESLGFGLQFKMAAPAPRGNPNLPIPLRYQYVPAFYVGMNGRSVKDWDFAFYPDRKDMALSGLMSSDMIRIPLGQQSLGELANWLRTRSYEEALGKKKIVDPHNGFAEWRSGTMRIINWTDIEGDPTLTSVRLLRKFLQWGKQDIPELLKSRLRKLISEQTQMHRLPGDEAFGRERVPRAIRKILRDPYAALALKRLAELGVIRKWSSHVEDRILQMSPAQISDLVSVPPDVAWSTLSKWNVEGAAGNCRAANL